jgi:hypothetical protein
MEIYTHVTGTRTPSPVSLVWLLEDKGEGREKKEGMHLRLYRLGHVKRDGVTQLHQLQWRDQAYPVISTWLAPSSSASMAPQVRNMLFLIFEYVLG